MNRRRFTGVVLAGLSGLFFQQKLRVKCPLPLVESGLTHEEMAKRIFNYDNQVVCSCLPFRRSTVPSGMPPNMWGTTVILDGERLYVKNCCGKGRNHIVNISEPDNKIIQFNRGSKKPIYYVRQNDQWTKI